MCLSWMGFPGSWAGKESAWNAGDPGLIPVSGRSPRKGTGYSLQCSWTSLVAQLVKNPPAMRETWVRSLGWGDPLEKRKPTHFSILAWRIPWTIQSMESQRVRHNWVTFTLVRSTECVLNEQSAVALMLESTHQILGTFPPGNINLIVSFPSMALR